METQRSLDRSRAARQIRDQSGDFAHQRARGLVGRALEGLAGLGEKARITRVDKVKTLGKEEDRRDSVLGSTDASATVSKPTRKKERREFFNKGGIIREADLSKDADAVNDLYLQSSAIEHFSEVTPQSSSKDLKTYYKTHPDSKLLVAEINGQIVGAITIYKEEGVNGVKLNRLVRRADKPGLGIAHFLIREALARSFADPEKGGYGAAYAIIGVILPKPGKEGQEVKGHEEARKAFKEFYFHTTEERIENRCVGWNNEEEKLVPRDVEQMALQRREHAFRWGNDIKRGTSLPEKKAA